jgi:signal transduction histidine kinase
LRHVPFFTVIILTVLNIYSVSAQSKGDAIALPSQYADATTWNDSQTVSHYTHLSGYYLNVNNDSSLYWADRTISFALLKNNLNYLQYGLQARKQAEQSILDLRGNQNSFLLDAMTQQTQKVGILLIISIFLFIVSIWFLILYLRKRKNVNIPQTNEADKEAYEERIATVESHLKEVEQKNTDLKNGYEELQVKYNNLQKTNDIKDKLIPMIAHDIRSPLASLQSTLSLTREHIINPEEFQKLSFALEADVFNLRGMLDNMLLWAREQMFEIKINKVKFDLSEVSRDVILMYRNNLVGKNITLHNYLPQHLEVNTDKEIIAAVFRNLFSNAVKFTEAGKNIYISQIFFNGKAYISVKDEGKGMPPETISKLKNKEHISTRGTANEKGTGLGLLFSREMINKLDEVFDITSYPEQGTSVTFSVSLT